MQVKKQKRDQEKRLPYNRVRRLTKAGLDANDIEKDLVQALKLAQALRSGRLNLADVRLISLKLEVILTRIRGTVTGIQFLLREAGADIIPVAFDDEDP